MIAPGDTQALPRIPAPRPVAGPGLPTVALTLAPAASEGKPANEPGSRPGTGRESEPEIRPEAMSEAMSEVKSEAMSEAMSEVMPEVAAEVEVNRTPEPVAEAPATTQVEAPGEAESHERIYAEAMATIAALASDWTSAVQRTPGRHRSAA